MHISKIEVFGFKSFAKKQTVVFDDSYIIEHIFEGPGLTDDLVFLKWSGGISPTETNIKTVVGAGLTVYTQDQGGDSYEHLTTLNNTEALPIIYSNEVEWVALWSKYFQKAITNQTDDLQTIVALQSKSQKINDQEALYIETDMIFKYANIENQKFIVESYIGPIDPSHLSESPHLDHLFYGKWYTMGPLKRLIIWLLTTLGGWGLNYGIICILFAFMIRLLFFQKLELNTVSVSLLISYV